MPVHGLSAAKHVKHDATAQVLDDTDPVNGLLHLAMPPVASFERIGGGGTMALGKIDPPLLR